MLVECPFLALCSVRWVVRLVAIRPRQRLTAQMLVIWGGAKGDGPGDGGGEKDLAAQPAKGNSKASESTEDTRAAVVARAQAAIEVPRFRAVARQLRPAPLPPRGDLVGVGASRARMTLPNGL